MILSLPEIAQVVKESGLVVESDLQEAVKTAEHLKVPLEDVVIGRRLMAKEQLGQLLAKHMGVGYVELGRKQISREVMDLVREEMALERRVVPFESGDGKLSLAMADPRDLETVGYIEKSTGLQVVTYLAFEKDIKAGLRQYKRGLSEEFRNLVGQVTSDRLGNGSLVELAEDVSVVEAVNKLLEFGVVEGASDIHIEALNDELLVRYRIDGILHDVLKLPRELHSPIVARIKIVSGLKLDETRMPQDGRMKFESDEGDKVSLRVSVLPTVEGEKVVLRILESGETQFALENLGLDKQGMEKVSRAIKRPNGLILVTGPTGSGKTTTLYTMLGLLNTSEVNISTVEDPVENRMRRVNQTQVNSRIKLGFATGLRALLRQDPDVIMVGEIRDSETAAMAVNAAMTGHLVLSTLHTNDAPGAIPRLIDLGAEPFLVASTLELVVAQRLVRKVCGYCREERPLDIKWREYLLGVLKTAEEKRMIESVFPTRESFGKGCERCKYSGYQGRSGLYEIFEADDEVREMILAKTTASKIKMKVIEKGMQTMLVDGLTKVGTGITTIEEVMRVAFT